ncbi:NifU family protein [Pseudobacteriovorax antillogorgiicola]|uniref:Fe-S cluster biogenesis protein NfuA, 4Fe-4S-binding domain n=1 Tax=Pseudobacteriovorax antillogorgiicola TaxID=1513793 RepID=A0A1Y6CII1_9BACT|nr:NifU family protein [Pseudobacteriovorax antillogorgiicola]TCS46689.1 Fe-S cluster biogenesis protein NfuA [Pseudobacteriovorax antillogorgiicola]SMF66759.1 Fe-S cluster biogenesis protein NfuA, 4Fe-4S-binding domain [Pseudobacteriovorax antillogorgiicola]
MEETIEQSLNAVELSQKVDGSWQATHGPSGKVAHGLNETEAMDAMRAMLGMDDDGSFVEPLTSDLFEGVANEIALYLEGPVSKMLELHSGFARLEAYGEGVATIRLGGGCQGCPSSRITLMNGVFKELQEKFGEDVVTDVQPVLD